MPTVPISTTSLANQQAVLIEIDPEVYSLDTVYAASYVFLDKSYVVLDKNKETERIQVFLIPKSEDARNNEESLKELAMKFSDELVNYAHYFSRAEATKGTVEKILQRALFSASPGLIEESEEQEIQELLNEVEEEDGSEDLTQGLKDNEGNNSEKQE